MDSRPSNPCTPTWAMPPSSPVALDHSPSSALMSSGPRVAWYGAIRSASRAWDTMVMTGPFLLSGPPRLTATRLVDDQTVQTLGRYGLLDLSLREQALHVLRGAEGDVRAVRLVGRDP